MIRLLVSVRNSDEAQQAIDAQVDLIDLKEPDAGSLGRPERTVIEDVLRTVNGRLPMSVALGELTDFREEYARELPTGIRYAKLGLARCNERNDWREAWSAALDQLPEGTSPVAVIYADWKKVGAPPPREVLTCAQAKKCQAVLIDTFDKRAGSLTSQWSKAQLQNVLATCAASGMLTVLGGALSWQTIVPVLGLCPDFVAVRGMVCVPNRTGTLDFQRAKKLAELVHGHRSSLLPA